MIALAGCASEQGESGLVACEGDGCASAATCPAGLVRAAETNACLDVAPAADCPSGTAAMLGSTECQPVGWTSCDAPFAKEPSGWGCRAVTPSACTGATREAIGRATCVPIG